MLDYGFYLMDCMEGMRQFPDGYFDLAIVDPPYGDGGVASQELNASGVALTATVRGGRDQSIIYTAVRENEKEPEGGGQRHYTFGLRKKYSTYQNRRDMGGEVRKKIIAWDVAPEQSYFDELFRVSRNQIIWGGNYFKLPPTRCFLIWRKINVSQEFSMAMAEYAWTSFSGNAKVFDMSAVGQPGRFHPTQKPVELYKWILSNFAKPGDKILDTHVGSASSLIACHDLGFKYVGFEIDPEYFEKAKARLDAAEAQQTIFDYI